MHARTLTIRLVRLAMAASLLIPCLLFAFASWTSYRNVKALADERIIRSLDVQQEQACKAFEVVDLTLDSASDLVSGMSDSDIRNNEERLHLQFKKLADAVAIVQSIWIYGKDGRALVSSRTHPPPQQSYSDRDFYRAHVDADIGTYYGRIYTSQFNGQPFFRSAGGCPVTACS
jgi:two-component system, NtrC family, sensor kinase